LHALLDGRDSISQYDAGAKCLILYEIMTVEQRLMSCASKFSSFVIDGVFSINSENFVIHKVGELYSTKWDDYTTTDTTTDVTTDTTTDMTTDTIIHSWKHNEQITDKPSLDFDDFVDTSESDDESSSCSEEDANNLSDNEDNGSNNEGIGI